jgi:hypothetical protein
MSEQLSMASVVEGRRVIRSLDKESKEARENAREVDTRENSAYTIGLFLVSPEVFIVTVDPKDESIPFELTVDRDKALDVYRHPYAYLDQSAA